MQLRAQCRQWRSFSVPSLMVSLAIRSHRAAASCSVMRLSVIVSSARTLRAKTSASAALAPSAIPSYRRRIQHAAIHLHAAMSAPMSAPATSSSHRPHLAVSAPTSIWMTLRPPSSPHLMPPSQELVRTLTPRSSATRSSHLKRSSATLAQSLMSPSPRSSRSNSCGPLQSRCASESAFCLFRSTLLLIRFWRWRFR